MQDYLRVIARRPRVGRADSIRVFWCGPAGPVDRRILEELDSPQQRNHWQLFYDDLLNAIQRLLLHVWISGGSVLFQKRVGLCVVPFRPVETTWSDVGTVQDVVEVVERCWTIQGAN